MNAYWNTDTFGPDQNTFDPSGIVGTAIEEGELELENETVLPEPDLLNIFSKQEKKENGNGIKLEDIAPQSETISQQELATDSEVQTIT